MAFAYHFWIPIPLDRLLKPFRRFQVKGEFSYDHWTNLTAKRKRDTTAASKDPMGGIMDLMRDMYEEGDDQTRKLIGEAMVR